VPTVATQLSKLRSLGVRTALDDFGAGDTDLARLRRLPLDVVKLAPPSTTGTTSSLAATVVEVAGRLGLTVVAEGLETADQVAVVREAGCRYGQGFHLARPASPEHIGAYLAELAGQPASVR
jgi:EAL domain-containing protein (putative c-di-GMP-specific phosphodiesterase class I)